MQASITIPIGKLLSGDESTHDQLFRASKDLGFFYVDIRDHPTREVAHQIELITSVAQEFSNQS